MCSCVFMAVMELCGATRAPAFRSLLGAHLCELSLLCDGARWWSGSVWELCRERLTVLLLNLMKNMRFCYYFYNFLKKVLV